MDARGNAIQPPNKPSLRMVSALGMPRAEGQSSALKGLVGWRGHCFATEISNRARDDLFGTQADDVVTFAYPSGLSLGPGIKLPSLVLVPFGLGQLGRCPSIPHVTLIRKSFGSRNLPELSSQWAFSHLVWNVSHHVLSPTY